jgi:hypothetical protein
MRTSDALLVRAEKFLDYSGQLKFGRKKYDHPIVKQLTPQPLGDKLK